jgi:hypothetical protein
MLPKFFLLFATAVSALVGWTIPADLGDGVYSVSFDAAGVATHTLLTPITNSTEISGSPRRRYKIKRDNRHEPHCGGYGLNHVDADNAFRDLSESCGGGLSWPPRIGFTALRGDVVTYWCNYAIGENRCYADELRESIVGIVDPACGSYNSGWDIRHDRFCSYGQEARSRDSRICGF